MVIEPCSTTAIDTAHPRRFTTMVEMSVLERWAASIAHRVSHDLHDPHSYLSNAGKGEDGEGEGLHLFEQAMLANLCPDNAEEAISFIPRWVSGHGRCTETPSFCPGCRVHCLAAVSGTLS
jgi:hypothetical protein